MMTKSASETTLKTSSFNIGTDNTYTPLYFSFYLLDEDESESKDLDQAVSPTNVYKASAVQKDPCFYGCCCVCCISCSRQRCLGRCGIVRKVKSLHELYQLKQNDRDLRKCNTQEWIDRCTLDRICERHYRWQNHGYYSGNHMMPDGTYAYLYEAEENPVYQTQDWKDWVIAYRTDFWQRWWGCDYEPICAKDCYFRLPHCGCGELFHGMKLVDCKLVPIAQAVATE